MSVLSDLIVLSRISSNQ